MIVKIGNNSFDSKNEPIMLILSSDEKDLIGNMGEQTKFLSYPKRDTNDLIEMSYFMKEESVTVNCNNCDYLNITEFQQQTYKNVSHRCNKHHVRLFHKSCDSKEEHLVIHPYIGCLGKDFKER